MISPNQELTENESGSKLHSSSGLGFGVKPIIAESGKREGKSRSQRKAEYRKLLKYAKSQPSLKSLVAKKDNDIVQAQRKSGSRGSGGA